ncbi:PAP2 domain protein [Thermoascus aurantiacus ATCC 26904]
MAPADRLRTLRKGALHISKRLVLSYVIDWILIIGTAAVGYAFGTIEPNHNPFSLTDPSISFPYAVHETVSTGVLVLAGLVAPAVIILLVTLIFIPGRTVNKNTPRSLIWKRKLWEWNAGWMGLGVSLAGVYVATQGLKDLYGKPRPDLLDRCDPDLFNIAAYAVSGLGERLMGAPTLVTWEICQNKSDMLRIDGFASFPSGHSSFSWAGLTYLTLWLCAKFSIAFPWLSHRPLNRNNDLLPTTEISIRDEGAAPPVYLLILMLVPLGVAAFISASRWFDHRHHGFDILFGSIMGVAFAWVGFRLYHLPIRRGAGLSWRPRSRNHAFFRAIEFPDSDGAEGWASSAWAKKLEMGDHQKQNSDDVERGRWSDQDQNVVSPPSEAAEQPKGSPREEV